jgi:hypothetical protein
MRTFIVGLVAMALALTGGACKKKGDEAAGGGDLCNYKSKCEKEEPMTPEKVTECQDMLADKDCGEAAKAMIACMETNEKCTAEGQTDQEAFQKDCEAQMKAFGECVQKKMEAEQKNEPPAANP